MIEASNITHKSPRFSVMERTAWLAGKTCGSVGYVEQAEDYVFSSAPAISGKPGLLKLEPY